MKIRKLRIVTIILSIVLVIAIFIPAYAVSEAVPTKAIVEDAFPTNVDEINMELNKDESHENATVEVAQAIPNTINDDYNTYELEPLSKGLKKPTDAWNFADGKYQGHISGLKTCLFTNYTYQPNSDGVLVVQGEFKRAYKSACTVLVQCYDAITNKLKSYYEFPTFFNEDGVKAVRFAHLDKNHTYYFKLSAVYDSSNSVTGSFHVRNYEVK